MVREVQTFAASIPANTPLSAPATIDLAMPSRLVRSVRVRFPPGPAGNVGVLLASGAQRILPINVGGFLVGDNEVFEWDLDQQIETGAWQLRGYNTGVYAHTVYVTFALDPLVKPAGNVLAPPLNLTA